MDAKPTEPWQVATDPDEPGGGGRPPGRSTASGPNEPEQGQSGGGSRSRDKRPVGRVRPEIAGHVLAKAGLDRAERAVHPHPDQGIGAIEADVAPPPSNEPGEPDVFAEA